MQSESRDERRVNGIHHISEFTVEEISRDSQANGCTLGLQLLDMLPLSNSFTSGRRQLIA
jgi:hypothetical protein